MSEHESRQEADASRRGEILGLLAGYGERRPEEVPEDIDSLELAWLVHQIEQRYGSELDLGDEALSRMATVSGAAEVLDELRLDGHPSADPDKAAANHHG